MAARNHDEPAHERERDIGRAFPTESPGVRLAGMPIPEAMAMRRKYGDEKYGHERGCSMLAEGYVEGIDLLNYAERAASYGELDNAERVTLMNLTGVVLDFLRKRIPRE